MSHNIYRITNLDRFTEIVEQQVLGFVSYDTWEDINEGYVLRALRTDEGQKKISHILHELGTDRMAAQVAISLLEGMCHSVHMQSWSLTEENDAMWKLYASDGNGIQIATSLVKIDFLEGVGYQNIRYEKLSLREELKRIVTGKQIKLAPAVVIQMDQVFATKSCAYDHEREVRLMTSIDTSLAKFHHQKEPGKIQPGIARELVTKLISNGDLKPAEMGTIMRQVNHNWLKQVSFAHIPNFIESVRVSPTATIEFFGKVKKICAENNLKFLGKSELYTYVEVE